MCGHGGIGRRVRLRGVWDDRVSSSLTGRTKKKDQVNRLGFFYATCGLSVLKTHAPMVQNSHCVSGAQLLCASTLVSLLRSLRSLQFLTGRTNRQAEMLVFFIWSAVDLRAIIYRTMPMAFNSHDLYRDASLI